MGKVYDWFEERLEIQSIADDITSKYVPPHVNIFLLLRRNYIHMFHYPGSNWIRDDILLQTNGI